MTTKSDRMLQIYSLLNNGELLHREDLAQRFHVTERSIQRDIESLRCFLVEQGINQEIAYDRAYRGYRLVTQHGQSLENSEVLAVCKILLESRSMMKEELFPIIDKLIENCVPDEKKKAVLELLANEKFHYIEPHHHKNVLSGLWELSEAIRKQLVIKIEYERLKEPHVVQRILEPVGIMFSEYYFYLTAFLRDIDRAKEFDYADDLFPTIYRIDRIRSFTVLDEHFSVPYKDRFEEGEFRKRIQFMYGGKLERIRFEYHGPSIEAVLDRLPTATIESEEDGVYIVNAEVFGNGIDMWIRSQGDSICLL